MVRFLFSPNDFKAPELLANMDVYYHGCTLRGALKGGVAHNCMIEPEWSAIPCAGCWKILGEQWIECYVVAANGSPLEKWRGITKYAIPGIRDKSYCRELVWKSPFSNSLGRIGPLVPRGRWVEWSKYEDEFGIWCKIENGGIRFCPGVESRIRKVFESQ